MEGSTSEVLLFDTLVVATYYLMRWEWMLVPWQPLSLGRYRRGVLPRLQEQQ
ncbi:MAG: hypothetical protein R2818_10130 [Flavobacteriales bacterium]